MFYWILLADLKALLASRFGYVVLILVLLDITRWLIANINNVPIEFSLNPCFTGYYSLINIMYCLGRTEGFVLILVLLDITRWSARLRIPASLLSYVLILVLLDITRWSGIFKFRLWIGLSLNPCFTGYYSLIALLHSQTPNGIIRS